ncbi:MAG: insulinase family protein [Gemmatimonadota bacterium]|nr:insulinase family protein [Gemmatimonadota bacterium]
MTRFIDLAAVTRTVLANGLTVLIYRNPAAPVVAVNTYVRTGYFDETDDVTGIAHVLEHMYFKGTQRYGVGEIAKATKAAGGYLNAHTIYDHTSYYAVLPSRGFDEGLAVQADAFANSAIESDALAKELEVIIQEAMRKQDNAGAVTTETLYTLLHDVHRIRRWRIGVPDQLRTFTRAKVMGFYRNFYAPSATVLAIAGDVDPEHALRRVDQLYGGLQAGVPVRHPGPGEPERSDFRYRELSGDVEQTNVEIGWRTVPQLHADLPPLDLAAALLGSGRASRLYRAVRDRKLAGSAGAYNYSPAEVGVFVVSSEGRPETAAEAARAMWAQVADVRDGRVSDEEIQRARQLFMSRWARHLETTEGQAAYLAEWESAGGWEKGAEYYDAFMAADANAVTRVARQYLTEDRAAAVTYRPAGAPVIAEDAAAFQKLLAASKPESLELSSAIPVTNTRNTDTPEFLREESGVRVYGLASGIPVLIRHRANAPITHFGVYAAAGSANEPRESAGISALAARTTSRGTTSRGSLQIAEESELLGGSIGASVGSEVFGWSLSVPSVNTHAAIALLADVVQHATLGDDVLETERSAMIADAVHLRDDMYRYPMRLATEAMYEGHPYSIPAGGTEETLRALSAETVREWYSDHLRRAPFVVALTGDCDPDEMASVIAGRFAELAPVEMAQLPPPSWPQQRVVNSVTREKTQTALVLGFPSPGRSDEDRFAAHVLSSIASGLGGRFFEELRDRRSLAYTVHAFGSEHRLGGSYIAYIATAPEREPEAHDALLGLFAELRETLVTEEEIDRAKRYLLGMHDIRQERGGAILGDMVDAWLFGRSLTELDQFPARIESVTREDIRRLARNYFDAERVVEGVVRGVARADTATFS